MTEEKIILKTNAKRFAWAKKNLKKDYTKKQKKIQIDKYNFEFANQTKIYPTDGNSF